MYLPPGSAGPFYAPLLGPSLGYIIRVDLEAGILLKHRIEAQCDNGAGTRRL